MELEIWQDAKDSAAENQEEIMDCLAKAVEMTLSIFYYRIENIQKHSTQNRLFRNKMAI